MTAQVLIRECLERVRQRITEQMSTLGRNASGRSVRSLEVEASENRGTLWGAGHFVVMETGRRGGRVPYGFRDIIRQWIIDKGIPFEPMPYKRGNGLLSPEERGLNSLAGAIAYSIMRNGTRLHRDGRTDDIYTTAINEELEELGKKIRAMYATKIEHITLHDLNENDREAHR